MTTCPFGLGLLRVYILSFTFPYFFFFLQHGWTVATQFMHMDSLWRRQSTLFTGPTSTFFRKKNIKNGSRGTLHTCKNYFVSVFSVFSFSKISCIWTDPTYFENLTIDYMFFIFLTHISNFVIFGYYLLYDA